MTLYFDHAASAPPTAEVIARVAEVQRDLFGNPGAAHPRGQRAARAVERVRAQIATHLGCFAERVVFTSGATEANNLAMQGVLRASRHPKPHLILSAVEHPSVRAVAEELAAYGEASFDLLPVNAHGHVNPDDLPRLLRPETALVSVMHVNNETGAVQPIAKLGRRCRAAGVPLHVDATQSFMKLPVEVDALHADLLTVGAHKMHGPKGVGALYVREGLRLRPLQFGGGQEGGLRAGTHNSAGIAGFGAAIAGFTPGEAARVLGISRQLRAALDAAFPHLVHLSPDPGGVGSILALRFAATAERAAPRGAAIAAGLARRGVQISASAACCSGLDAPSPVLLAMGLSAEQARGNIRLSVGRTNDAAEIPALISALRAVLDEIATEAPRG